jgi:hypothetical protein
MKMMKNLKKLLGLGFLILFTTVLLLLPVGGYNNGHTPGSGANDVYWDCDGSSCHGDLSAATISMSASKLNPQTNEQITVSVTVSGSEASGTELGIMLYKTQTGTATDLPSDDGWVLVSDPSGSTQFWYYEWASVTGGISGTWTLNAPPTGGTYYIYARDHHGSGGKYYADDTTGLTFTVTAPVNNPPEAQDPTVEGFSSGTPAILHIMPHGPTLGWTFFDSDGGDVQTDYEVRVGTGSGLNDMWAPGPTTSGAASVAYGGSPLIDNTDYWFGVRVNDGTEWSVWNETMFHMNSVEAQALTVQNFADLSLEIMHITDHTPYLNWTFWDGEADSQTQYEIRVGTAPGLSNMWGPAAMPGATTSEIYAGSPLLHGNDYWFGVRIYDGYEWSFWNETLFHLNSVDAQDPTVSGFSDPSLEILHITDHTPLLGWTFFDNDGDSQLQYEIRVGTAPGLSDMWSPGAQVGGSNSDIYFGLPLADFTDYWYAIRVYDGFQWSPWNEVQFHLNNFS